MQAIDHQLIGNESFLQEIHDHHGPVAVQQYVINVNNSLQAMNGFEEAILHAITTNADCYMSPITNNSVALH